MSDEPKCSAGCGRPSPGAYLCRDCARVLEQAIAELPAALVDLEAVATRQARGPLGLGDPLRSCERGPGVDALWTQPGPSMTGALGDEPWPFAPGAADLLWGATNTLVTWIRHLCESRGVDSPQIAGRWDYPQRITVHRNRWAWATTAVFTPFASQPLGPLCTWLVANVESIRQDEAAGEIYDELTWLSRAVATAALGRPPATEFHGLCDCSDVRVEVDGDTLRPVVGQCGAQIWSAPGAEPIDCPVCGASYTRAQRRASMLEQLADTLGTVSQVATVLTDLGVRVTVNQIGHWLRRGQIASRGGVPRLVRVGDVIERQRETAARHPRRVA